MKKLTCYFLFNSWNPAKRDFFVKLMTKASEFNLFCFNVDFSVRAFLKFAALNFFTNSSWRLLPWTCFIVDFCIWQRILWNADRLFYSILWTPWKIKDSFEKLTCYFIQFFEHGENVQIQYKENLKCCSLELFHNSSWRLLPWTRFLVELHYKHL